VAPVKRLHASSLAERVPNVITILADRRRVYSNIQHLFNPRLPNKSLCPSRHTQHLPGALPQLSHLAPPQRSADVYEVCRHDDGRTRPPSRRMGQHHSSRRSPHRLSAKNLTFHATIQANGSAHPIPASVVWMSPKISPQWTIFSTGVYQLKRVRAM
jgi:hypothetical protein